MILSLIALLISNPSHALNLLQEDQEILCSNSQISITIDKKDRHIDVQNKEKKYRYNSVEFLDSGILLKNPQSSKNALIQLTPKETAVLIEGDLIKFNEGNCKDQGAKKICNTGKGLLSWSSDALSFEASKSKTAYDVHHYGVHPNDGTYFIALAHPNEALGILDSGEAISIIKGSFNKLNCDYK